MIALGFLAFIIIAFYLWKDIFKANSSHSINNNITNDHNELYHPINNYGEKLYKGFSFPCLFFGFFWFIYKGMYGWAVGSFLAAFLTFGISNLFFPFFANKMHKNHLLKLGYLNSSQIEKQ